MAQKSNSAAMRTTKANNLNPAIFPSFKTKIVHLSVLFAGTFWWYVLTAVIMFRDEEGFFRISPKILKILAILSAVSQLGCMVCVWYLMEAKSFLQGRFYMFATMNLCIPVDALIVIYDPLEATVLTHFCFFVTTLFYSTVLIHHLRLAALREEFHAQQEQIATTSNNTRRPGDSQSDGSSSTSSSPPAAPTAPAATATNQQQLQKQKRVVQLFREYRPTNNFQVVWSALKGGRDFAAFTISLTVIVEAIKNETEAQNGWVLVILILVGIHESIESALSCLFPGIKVPDKWFVAVQAAMYLLQMIASIVLQSETDDVIGGEDASIWDELMIAILFVSGADGFFVAVRELVDGFDVDKWLGLGV